MKSLKLGSIIATAMLFVSIIATTAQPPGGGQRGPQGTPEEMAKAMSEQMAESLDLSAEQQESIYNIQLEAFEARSQTQQGERPSREEMMAAREEMNEKVKAILTEDQIAMFEKMESERSQGAPQRQGGRR